MTIRICNANLNLMHFYKEDTISIYIFTIGYESRSFYLMNKLFSLLNRNNTLVFAFNDYEEFHHTKQQFDKLKDVNIEPYVVTYESYKNVPGNIIHFIKKTLKIKGHKIKFEINIDYSSMPRSWYCRIPSLLTENLNENVAVFFWYTEGKYPVEYNKFLSAGIKNFYTFSGIPSLNANKDRSHIIGLGFDILRSQAILTIIEPSYFVACFCYPSQRKDYEDKICEVNNKILTQADETLSLHMDDFSFMISTICNTVNRLSEKSDVILIPDGPKPLILATSIVPTLLNKVGITCIHISRNDSYVPLNVESTGNVYGFSLRAK